MRDKRGGHLWLCLMLLASGEVAHAEEVAPAVIRSSSVILADSASPFGPTILSDAEKAAAILPVLEGNVSPEDELNFDKYFYFRRADTDVDRAFGDIVECDGYARGLVSGMGYQPMVYPATMAGALGGAVGNVLVAAIFGSAERRKLRRENMRNCMAFKGYQRFGLPKALWTRFNFEEGFDGVPEEVRRKLLLQQAFVAASSTPAGKALD